MHQPVGVFPNLHNTSNKARIIVQNDRNIASCKCQANVIDPKYIRDGRMIHFFCCIMKS